jgi:hypothetical protein
MAEEADSGGMEAVVSHAGLFDAANRAKWPHQRVGTNTGSGAQAG